MPRSFALLAAVASASLVASNVQADTTTGFKFHLEPGEAPLHNVYVFMWDNTSSNWATEYLTSSIYSVSNTVPIAPNNINPPGFPVPTGDSQIDLVGVAGSNADKNVFAMIGLETDPNNQDHVVLATNADLTNVNLFTVLPNDLGISENDYATWLKTGFLGAGEETGLLANFDISLIKGGYGQALGQSAQLFYFSSGQKLEGATVTANDFGVPVGNTVPEPASLAALAIGSLAILTRRRV